MPTYCRLRVSWKYRASRTRRWSNEQRHLTRKKQWLRLNNDRSFLCPQFHPYIESKIEVFRVIQVYKHRVALGLSIYCYKFPYIDSTSSIHTSSSSLASKPSSP
jgi:hypothetical protein